MAAEKACYSVPITFCRSLICRASRLSYLVIVREFYEESF